MNNNDSSLICVRSLSFSYPSNNKNILSDISFDIKKGDYVSIAGSNGSGKSTLVRCLDGLLVPPEGTVLIDGLDPANSEQKIAIHKKLALVFQSPSEQIVSSIVEDDVAFGLENISVPEIEIPSRIDTALKKVNLLSEKYRPTRYLSAGLSQRLAIADAIAMDPQIIIFDEATAMIDPIGSNEILSLMAKLNDDGITIIHVTHNMDEILHSKRTLVLNNGKILFDGKPTELFASGAYKKFNFILPSSCILADKLSYPYKFEKSPQEFAKSIVENGTSFDVVEKVVASGIIAYDKKPVCSNEVIFEFDSVSMTYLPGTVHEKRALKNINLKIYKGQIVAIVGKTGSGKSSLLNILASLALPDEGAFFSYGTEINKSTKNVRDIRMKTPLLVQRPERAIFENFIADEVAFGPLNKGLKGQELISCVKNALALVDLPFDEWKDVSTRALSGGQKRKLALASVLALNPDSLLLDEACSSLDPISQKKVLKIITDFAHKGQTVVMVTHSMEEALLADRVILVHEGQIEMDTDPYTFFSYILDKEFGIVPPFEFEALHCSFLSKFKSANCFENLHSIMHKDKE